MKHTYSIIRSMKSIYHIMTFIKCCNWLNIIEILHFTFRLYILYLCAHYLLKFNLDEKFFNTIVPVGIFICFDCHIDHYVNSK